MELCARLQEARHCAYWLLEEVDAFRKPSKRDGVAPSQKLAEQLRDIENDAKIEHVERLQLDGGIWIEGSRHRCVATDQFPQSG